MMNSTTMINSTTKIEKYNGCLIEFTEVQKDDKIQLNRIRFFNDKQKEIKITNIQINCKKCEGFDGEFEGYTNLILPNNKKWCTNLSYFPNKIVKIAFKFQTYEIIRSVVFISANDFPNRDPKTFSLYGLSCCESLADKNKTFTNEETSNMSILMESFTKRFIHQWTHLQPHKQRSKEKEYIIDEQLNNKKIPNNIFQTHKSMEYVVSKRNVNDAVMSWKRVNDFNYFFYSDDDCVSFMKEHFDEKINNAYNKCPLAVMKADLWRYCIIYVYGGIYTDSDTILHCDPSFLTNQTTYLALTTENNVHFCQWIFAAPQHSPILKEIIQLSVKRIIECRDFTSNNIIHSTTGPGVFSDGIFLYLIKNKQHIHDKSPQYDLLYNTTDTIDDTNNNNNDEENKNDNSDENNDDIDNIVNEAIDFKYICDRNCNKYINYKDHNSLIVFDPDDFHYKKVSHFFTGQSSDGWCNQHLKMKEANIYKII